MRRRRSGLLGELAMERHYKEGNCHGNAVKRVFMIYEPRKERDGTAYTVPATLEVFETASAQHR